jgi:glycosyltransferase involved in cell wall biosynthesis
MPGKRYKILYVTGSYPGRVHPLKGIFFQRHIEAFAAGHDAAVLHVVSDPQLRETPYDITECIENGVLVVRAFYRKSDLHNPLTIKLRKLFRYLKASYLGLGVIAKRFGRPALIQANTAMPAGLIAAAVQKIKDIPFILYEQFSDYTEEDGTYNAFPWYRKAITGMVFHQAKAVVAVSRYLLSALKKQGLVKGPTFVVPNVIPMPSAPKFVPKPDSIVNMLTISLLNDGPKNVAGLIKAVSRVVPECNNIHLHIIGDGDDRKALEELAAKHGLLGSHITFHGMIANEKLGSYFNQAHFFVMNSNFETFSVATIEAISHGLPVVVTNCGGPDEYVTRQIGLVVQRRNEASMAEGIKYMAQHWGEYDPLTLHRYAKEKFAAGKSVELFSEIYRQVLSW